MDEQQSSALAEIKEKVDEIFRIKKKKAEYEELIKAENAKQSALEMDVKNVLQAAGLDSFKGNEAQLSLTTYENYRVPSTLEEQKKFAEWLRTQGEEIFYKYLKVNSQALQTLVKEERASADDRGEYDFKIPGLGEPALSIRVNVRKKGN